jgi:hypothetical protein
LPRGVMVAQETLDLFVLVRVQARQPRVLPFKRIFQTLIDVQEN